MLNKTTLRLFSPLIVFVLYSFQPEKKLADKLIGVWVYNSKDNLQTTYILAKEFNKDERGIAFKKGGRLLIRTSDGSSESSPVYANYEGIWNVTSDSVMTISYTDKSWIIEKEKTWKIVSLEPAKLTVRKITCRKNAKDNM